MRVRWIVAGATVALAIVAAVGGVAIWRNAFVVTRATDVTFVDAEHGWALTTHGCGAWHRCLRVLRTVDGGRSWQSAGVPPGAAAPRDSLPCENDINVHRPCIDHLHFADARTGYAWSSRLLYVTRDGGWSWSRRTGGAATLATVEGGVLRTRYPSGGAVVERADQDAREWRIVTRAATRAEQLDLVQSSAQVLLVDRSEDYGPDAVVRGAVTISTSADSGRTWRRVNLDPCGAPGSVATAAVLPAPDGSAVAACSLLPSGRRAFCESVDGVRTFDAVRAVPSAHDGDPWPLLAASRSVLLAFHSAPRTGEVTRIDRTADGGRTWQRVTLPAHGVHTMAFPTPTFGYAITANYRGVAYSHDAGATWRTAYLP